MKDPNGNNNKKDDEVQRYKDIFNSFNEVSETDEVLHQLAALNFNEEKNINKNDNIKSKLVINEEEQNILNEINIQNININNEEQININNNEEKPLSLILLKEKINRIYITMQGLNFRENYLNYLNDFVPYLHNIEQKNYKYVDKLFDVYFELLSRIKQEINIKDKFIEKLNNVSLGIENYEKKNIINQKKIKDKENEIIILMNKLNLEKEKNKDNSKSILLENNSLKKENSELTDTILLYKNKLRKTEADYQVIQEKIKNLLVKENKAKLSSFISNTEEKNENGLNSKINDKYFSIKKLNMSLTYLLKEINKMLIKYDNSLIKLINNKNNSQDKVTDLNCNIETNLLLDEANMKIFRKNFLYNMDRIFKKIELMQKNNKDIKEIQNNYKINNNEIKGAWKNNIINKKVNEEGNKINNNKLNSSNIDNNGNGDIKDEKHFKNNISSKWYDKYNNKKIGYVFDKEKVITCEDDDNGAK